MSVLFWIVFGLLALNGLRSALGIPPVLYWRRGTKVCDCCDGQGWLKGGGPPETQAD